MKMFYQCDKIIEINLSKFNTSQVTDMSNMFAWCGLLSSLDISNIDTSKVINMGYIFYRCTDLNSLNLSNFNTLKVNNSALMFAESAFIYLNLSSFDMTNVRAINRMFYGSIEYVYFKIAKIYINNIVNNPNNPELLISTSSNSIIACENGNDFLMDFFNEKNLIYCNNKYSYQQIRYIGYMKNSTKYNKYTCDIFRYNFYNKYNRIKENNIIYIYCYEIINNYYLDENDLSYKPCYYTCKRCEINGNEINHNCILCKDDFFGEIDLTNSNAINCYNNIFYYFINYLINNLKYKIILLYGHKYSN